MPVGGGERSGCQKEGVRLIRERWGVIGPRTEKVDRGCSEEGGGRGPVRLCCLIFLSFLVFLLPFFFFFFKFGENLYNERPSLQDFAGVLFRSCAEADRKGAERKLNRRM